MGEQETLLSLSRLVAWMSSGEKKGHRASQRHAGMEAARLATCKLVGANAEPHLPTGMLNQRSFLKLQVQHILEYLCTTAQVA